MMAQIILVVDDDDAIRVLLEDVLTDAGYQAFSARNGKEGLAQAQQRHPDLVISDLVMPILGGIDMTRTLRADPALHLLPVVAMSGMTWPDATTGALFAAFLAKPFNLIDLLDVVQRALGCMP